MRERSDSREIAEAREGERRKEGNKKRKEKNDGSAWAPNRRTESSRKERGRRRAKRVDIFKWRFRRSTL